VRKAHLFLLSILLVLFLFPVLNQRGEGSSSTIPSRGNFVDADSSRNNGVVIWRYYSNFSYSVYPPAVDSERGRIYSVGVAGMFYALNLSGRLLWSTSVPSGTSTTAAIDLVDGTVYLHLSTGYLAAYSPDGELLWKMPSTKYSHVDLQRPVAYPAGGVVFKSNYTYVRASSDGKILATYNLNTDFIDLPPAIDEKGLLYFLSNFHVSCFTPNGTLLWNRTISREAYIPPVVSPTGHLYYVDREDTLHCIYTANGSEKWSISFNNSYTRCLGLTPIGDPIVVCGNKLMRLTVDGDVPWMREMETDITGVVSDNKYLYCVGHNLTKLFLNNGTIIWINSNHPWRTSPVMDSRGIVYVHAGDSNFYAIGPGPDYGVFPEDVVFPSNEIKRWAVSNFKVRVRNLGEDSYPAMLYVKWRPEEDPDHTEILYNQPIIVEAKSERWVYLNWTPSTSGNGTLTVSVYNPYEREMSENAPYTYVERVRSNNQVEINLYVEEVIRKVNIKVSGGTPCVINREDSYEVRISLFAEIENCERNVTLYFYVENTTIPEGHIFPEMYSGYANFTPYDRHVVVGCIFIIDRSVSGTHSINIRIMVPENESATVEPDTLNYMFILKNEKDTRKTRIPIEIEVASIVGGTAVLIAVYYLLFLREDNIRKI